MPIIELVILLACLVLLSNVLSHYLVAIPVSLIQVGLGLGVALLLNVQVKLQTDWFMLVFIAPMLYNDGREFPNGQVKAIMGGSRSWSRGIIHALSATISTKSKPVHGKIFEVRANGIE